MVMHLIKILLFYINYFLYSCSIYQVLLSLTILDDIVLDFNIYFQVIFSKFILMFKCCRNTITLIIIDTISLGPNGNLQGYIQYFSLISDKILYWE